MISIQAMTPTTDLRSFDRILLHLRCLYHDHKYRWHQVSGANSGPGIEENQSHRPPREPRPSMTSTRQVIRRGQNLQNNTSNQNQQILNALANLGHGALAHW